MASFHGPFKFRTKRSLQLCDTDDAQILRATIDFNGTLTELPVNSISISISPIYADILDVEHSYDYIENDKKMYGRWYDSVPMNTFRTLPGATYIHRISYYEDDRVENGGGPAVLTIYFTEEAAQTLRLMFNR